jgi:hypothetical protein
MSPAALPKVLLNSNYPNLGVNHHVWTVGKGKQFSNCQPAIDSALPGDQVVIDAGFICSPIILRNKGTSTDYIVIRTSNLNLLPPQGTRISHSDAPNLAIIQTSVAGDVVNTEAQANHYHLVGLDIRLDPNANFINYGALVRLGMGTETSIEQLPHDIVIARCWVHAGPLQEQKGGIVFNASATSIVDSVVEEIHAHNNYASGIAGWEAAPGPFKIVNNEISSAGLNLDLGGTQTLITGLIPSDIEFRKNYIHKDPAWLNPVTSTAGIKGLWYVTNLVWLYNAQRILFDGNIFEFNWPQPLAGFPPYAITIWPWSFGNGTVGSGQPWVRVQDVTFINNIIRHSAAALEIIYQDSRNPQAVAQRLDFENNLIYDIGPQWGNANGLILTLGDAQGPTVFSHNTMLDVADTGPVLFSASAADGLPWFGGVNPQLTYSNNLTNSEAGGFSGSAGTGAPVLNAQFPGITFAGNALAGENATDYQSYLSGNFFPEGLSDIGFTADPTSGVADYHTLSLSPVSPFAGKATDGTNIGVDISKIDAAMQ